MRVLFWNIRGHALEAELAQLAAEYKTDLLIVAEPDGIDNLLLTKQLTKLSRTPFGFHDFPPQPRLRFFTRFPIASIIPLEDAAGIAVRQITHPGCQSLIMVAVHSSSQLHWSQPSDRFALALRIRETLERAEAKLGHRRSFVVGDFNSDPYDDALVNSDALHAVMEKGIAAQQSRLVGGEERHFLYNPMWSLLGDNSPGPPGTYFYRKAVSSCRFWHVFDQVLIRPALTGAFDNATLAVITAIEGRSLLRPTGEPDADAYSDHLPLFFSIDVIGNFANV